MPVFSGEAKFVIDLAEGANGEIYFVAANGVYQLTVPMRGDCNGDAVVNVADYELLRSLVAGGPRTLTSASSGTWGCDVNGDGALDSQDLAMLLAQLHLRGRAVC